MKSNVVKMQDALAVPIVWSDERSSAAARMAWHEEAIQDIRLKWPARLVASYLLHRFNGGVGETGGTAWPSYRKMADDLGVSQPTIKRGVTKLVARGWLKKFRNSRTTTNIYVPSRNPHIADGLARRREELRLARAEDREQTKLARGPFRPLGGVRLDLPRGVQPDP